MRGKANLIEDFATLADLTLSTDAMWLSSAYAVRAQIADGSLVEFFRAQQSVDVVLYALKKRSRSPLAEAICTALRLQTASISV